jgi:hypothetical protein
MENMSAILLIGNDVIKVSNLKYFKLNKDAIILEKCSKDQLQDKYNYWYNTINYKNIKLNDLKYCFKNIKTGDVIYSMYDNLNNIPQINKDEWI